MGSSPSSGGCTKYPCLGQYTYKSKQAARQVNKPDPMGANAVLVKHHLKGKGVSETPAYTPGRKAIAPPFIWGVGYEDKHACCIAVQVRECMPFLLGGLFWICVCFNDCAHFQWRPCCNLTKKMGVDIFMSVCALCSLLVWDSRFGYSKGGFGFALCPAPTRGMSPCGDSQAPRGLPGLWMVDEDPP